MTPTYVKADDWSLTPLSPTPRSRDRAELRRVDDEMMALLVAKSQIVWLAASGDRSVVLRPRHFAGPLSGRVARVGGASLNRSPAAGDEGKAANRGRRWRLCCLCSKKRLEGDCACAMLSFRTGICDETPHCQFENHDRVRVGWGFEGTARSWGRRQSRWLRTADGFAVCDAWRACVFSHGLVGSTQPSGISHKPVANEVDAPSWEL